MHFKQDFHVYQNPIKEDCLQPRGHHEDTTSHSDQVQRPIFKVIFRSKQPQVKVICNGQNRLSCQQSYHSNLSPTSTIYKLSKYQTRHLHTLESVMPMKRKFPTRILAYHLYRAQTSFHSQSHQGQWYIDEHSSRETTHKTIDALSLKTIIRLSMKEIY